MSIEEDYNKAAKDERRFIASQLDFNLEVLEPSWKNATPSMLNKVNSKIRYITLKEGQLVGVMPIEGQVFICVDDILTNLDFFTKDIRLSNFNDQDIKEARWWLDYAVICAQNKYFTAFNYCLGKVANICETSQGKNGFLRKMFNTFRSENLNTPLEPQKKSWISGKSSGGQ